MKGVTRIASAFIALGLVAGCDMVAGKHEIVRAGNQTFLLNKASGETKLIEGVTLIPIKTPDKAPGDDLAKQAKNWPQESIRQLGDIKLAVRTKYRDGNMLYSIKAQPFKGRLEKEFVVSASGADYLRQPTIYVDFYDSDGFQTGEGIQLKIRGATRVVNDKDEVHALSWTGAQPMSLDTYRAATIHNVRWSGFGKE